MTAQPDEKPIRTAPRLPEDAHLLGYNRDVGFFLSESAGLVYVVQGGVIWAFPRVAGPPREESTE